MKCKTITKWQDGTIIQNSYYRELINGDTSIFFLYWWGWSCHGLNAIFTITNQQKTLELLMKCVVTTSP